MSRFLVGWMLVSVAAGGLLAEDPTEVDTKRRREFLKTVAMNFSLVRRGTVEAYPLTEDPVLRYSNPTNDRGSTHGATFLWLDGVRPVAACSFSMRRPDDSVAFEMTLLSGAQVSCSRDDEVEWQPASQGMAFQRDPQFPNPVVRKPQRLAQMRSLARRFKVTSTSRAGDKRLLRLLPQPLYRYEDTESGLVDGALFGFVVSNDPEALLQIEAVEEGGNTFYRYRFARMTSAELDVASEADKLWHVDNFYVGGRSTEKPYLEGRYGMYDAETGKLVGGR